MREREIEKILVDEVRKAGGLCYKFVSPGNGGVPDRMIVMSGRVYFVELKAKTGKLTKLQRVQLDRLCSQGAWARVVCGLEGLYRQFQIMGMERSAKKVKALLDAGEV